MSLGEHHPLDSGKFLLSRFTGFSPQQMLPIVMGLVFLITFVLVGGVVSYRFLTATKQSHDSVEHSYRVLRTLDNILLDLVNAEAGWRGYGLTRNPEFLQAYSNALQRMDLDLPIGSLQTADNPTQQHRFRELEPLVRQRLALLQEGLEAPRAGTGNKAWQQNSIASGQKLMEKIRPLIDVIQQEEWHLLGVRNVAEEQKTHRTILAILVSTCLLFMLLLIFGGLVFRELVRSQQAAAPLGEEPLSKPWVGYVTAVVGTCGAAGARWALNMIVGQGLSPYTLFYPVVIFSALLAGTRAGLLATALSAGTVIFLFLPPRGSFRIEEPTEYLGLALFCGINIAVSIIGGALRTAWARTAAAGRRAEAAKEKLTKMVQLLDLAKADLEQRVAERTANLEATVKSLETVAYNMAHDLRAPNRAMVAFSEVLVSQHANSLDAPGRDLLERIRKAAERNDTLIRDMLAYARLAHEVVPLSPQRLEASLSAVLEQLAETIQANHAKIEIKAPFPGVVGNAVLLEQVLANLLNNALKFVTPGVSPEVVIRAEEREQTERKEQATKRTKIIRVWIEDKGIGIKPEYQERVFGVFEKLHDAETYPGTGIGLAIVQKAMERMGGRVGVKSEAGQGSCFWFELTAP